MVTFFHSARIHHQTMIQNRLRLSLHLRFGGLLSRPIETSGASHHLLESASLWTLGHGTRVCAYGTAILTNREPSELVRKRIFLCHPGKDTEK